MKIFKDTLVFLNFFLNKKKINECFFIENEYTHQYLEKYILKSLNRNHKILIFSLKKIKINNSDVLTIETNFFRQLFFLTLSCKYLITTTPNLNNSFFQKSLFNRKIKYIYIQHSHISLINNYYEKSFLYFNAIQVINKSQKKDVDEINKIYKKNIKIFKSRYEYLKNENINEIDKKECLIAPSWNTDFYKLNLHYKITDILIKNNISFIFRPHPMSLKLNQIENNFKKKYFKFIDLQSKADLKSYNHLITDLSGIFIEFALIKKKFPIVINLSKQNLNDNFEKFEHLIPFETTLKKKIAYLIDTSEINSIPALLNHKDKKHMSKIIDNVINNYIY